jgi:murein DD-endopeptidase MepM/ murein hydrolase activator NlpD
MYLDKRNRRSARSSGFLLGLLVVIIVLGGGAGAAWYMAGRAAGPVIEIAEPTSAIGQLGRVVLKIDSPSGKLTALEISIEQMGTRLPVLTTQDAGIDKLQKDADGRIRVERPIGKRQFPELKAGDARIVVNAVRPVLFGYRTVASTASRDIQVNLTPPQIAVRSAFHFINYGGSEMVVYRLTPPNATSGVRVGEVEYPGFPAEGAGITNAEPGLHVAFFALLWNQDDKTPISVFARDAIGNQGTSSFDYRILPKKFRDSRISVDDRFLGRVVPAILQNSTELKVENPADLVASFLTINRELRRQNNETIAALAKQSAPKILWEGAFKQLSNTAVEAGFADRRTYTYNDKNIDEQTHLGFDLASNSAAPVEAANSGQVVFAGWLGIYGNCVVVDHGMGLQSLYAHLSSIDVKVGDSVRTSQSLGRTGATGMAGGDHLHFTMLLGGNPVTPVDWWSQKWVQDRILRKLREAGPVQGASTGAQQGR